MPDYLFYNPSDPVVPNRAVRHVRSIPQSEADAQGYPYIEAYNLTAPVATLKVDGGVPVVMSQAELDAINAAAAASTLAGRKDRLVDLFDTDDGQVILLKSVVTLMVQQFNTLRALHGLAALDAATVRTALRNQIQSEIDALT